MKGWGEWPSVADEPRTPGELRAQRCGFGCGLALLVVLALVALARAVVA